MSWQRQYDEVQSGEIWYRDYDALKHTTHPFLKQIYCGHFPTPDLSLSKIRKGEFWGIADAQGTVLVPPQWDGIGVLPWTEDLFLIWRWDEEAYIYLAGLADRTGRIRLMPHWEMILTAEENRVLVVMEQVNTDGNVYYESVWVDWDGTVVDRPDWKLTYNRFVDGAARVILDGKVNYVDLTGHILFDSWWDDIGEFGGQDYFSKDKHPSSLTWVRAGDRFGFVSLTGKVVIPPIFEDAKDFGRGSDGLYGYADTDRAAVKWQGKWGYIDSTGALVIDCHWDSAEPFEEGVARVTLDSQEFLLNPEGFILPHKNKKEKPSPAFFFDGNKLRAREVSQAFFRSSESWQTEDPLRLLFIYLAGRIPLIQLLEEFLPGIPGGALEKNAALYRRIAPVCLEYLENKRGCTREEKAELDRFLLSTAEEYMQL